MIFFGNSFLPWFGGDLALLEGNDGWHSPGALQSGFAVILGSSGALLAFRNVGQLQALYLLVAGFLALKYGMAVGAFGETTDLNRPAIGFYAACVLCGLMFITSWWVRIERR